VSPLAFASRTDFESTVNQTDVAELEHYELTLPKVYFPGSTTSTKLTASPDTSMTSRPVTLTTVTGARVYLTGGRHAVQTDAGDVVSMNRVSDERLAEIPWQNHQHLSGTSLLLGNSAGADCYYHWMMDLLPKLGYLQSIGMDLSEIDHFLVRSAQTSFQKQTLTKLGIDASRIIETADHPYLQCDEALIINLDHRINMSMNRFVPHWIRDTYLEKQTRLPGNRKLYITRPEGVRRGVENESELLPIFKAHGFEVLAMEGLTIGEQAAILSDTTVLASPHGGALTNMVFAKSGMKIIELFGEHVYPYYYGLSNLCGHDYHALLQRTDHYSQLVQLEDAIKAGTAESQRVTQEQGFTVDPEALDRALQA